MDFTAKPEPDRLLKEAAIDAGLIRGTDEGEPNLYALQSGGLLYIETIDGQSLNSAPHFKDMTERRFESASPAQVEATVLLCALAAGHFRKPSVAGHT